MGDAVDRKDSYPVETAKFLDLVATIAREIEKAPGTVRIISHYDGDGISAAGILSKLLAEKDVRFHTTLVRDLDRDLVERLKQEKNSVTIFLDMGSGQIELVETLGGRVIVGDHHTPIRESKKVVQLNPHFYGIDGTYEACGATIAFLIAEAVSEDPGAYAGLALAGMLADRQHLGGLRGINSDIVERYVAKKVIVVERSLQLQGETLDEALVNSVEPFFRGISGEKSAAEFLKKLKINPNSRLESLTEIELEKLTSFLFMKLLSQDSRPDTIEDFVIDRYWLPRHQIYGRIFSAVINATGRLGQENVGLALCLGDPDALDDAKKLREEYRGKIKRDLIELAKRGPNAKEFLQFFYSEDAARAGALAALGMNYLFDQEKPTLALSKVQDSIKVSARGTRYLIGKGLDLARACREAAGSVSGEGGGHPIAAGATIPLAEELSFLERMNKIIGEQISTS
jgi:RecJ-like exonuclease